VESSQQITFCDGDFPLARWTVTVCHDFRGFPELPSTPHIPAF
jgi:hypothetical protein